MALDRTQFKQAVTENTLRSCQLFMGLPAADIVAIATFVIPKHLAKGDYLFREGDPAEGFYIVQKGAVNVHRVNAAGKEQVIHLFRPIESFAEAALASVGGYPADGRATEESTVRAETGLRRAAATSTRARAAHARIDEPAPARARRFAG